MSILKEVLKRNIAAVLLWFIFNAIAFSVAILYGIMIEPFVYAAVLTLFFLIVFLIGSYIRERKRATKRVEYHKKIAELESELEKVMTELRIQREESDDYYTRWVHQIKTPIAVMKLKLSEDTPENRALSAELFRIEQYVDMALQYIRLGSDSNDLMIQEYSLDDMIKETLRKFAPQFVEKKLALEYKPVNMVVVTDRKWFICIIEQLISNAIKYTPSGKISIVVEGEKLTIADTGIGIASDDLPRIFEKGYTGNNGRIGEKSSGLGLYLAKKAADMLTISLGVESEAGKGSRFTLRFTQN